MICGIIAGGTVASDGSVTSTQWRLNFTGKVNSGSWYSLTDVEMRGIAGGANLAIGGTASASAYDSRYPPLRAFDGNTSTFWQSGNSTTAAWLQYTFPHPVTIDEIFLQPYANSDTPTGFDVQYFDGETWQTYWNEAGVPWSGTSSRVFTKPTVKSRWRLNITDTVGTGNWIYLTEIELRMDIGGADATTAGQPVDGTGPLANFISGAYVPFNGNLTDQWGPGSMARPVWIGWEFNQPTDINEIAITGSATGGDCPKSFTVEYFDGSGLGFCLQPT